MVKSRREREGGEVAESEGEMGEFDKNSLLYENYYCFNLSKIYGRMLK